MTIGVLRVDLRIVGAQSLKGKRQVIKSIKDRIRAKFNVSVAEVSHEDLWQMAGLAIVLVSNSLNHAHSMLSNVMKFMENEGDVEIIDMQTEFL